MKSYSKFEYLHSRKCDWKCRLGNGGHFVSASICWPMCMKGRTTVVSEIIGGIIRCHIFCILYTLRSDTAGTHHITSIITMAADALAPNRRQATSNHHADSLATAGYNNSHTIWRNICIAVINKQCESVAGRSATHRFICYWRVRHLTRILSSDVMKNFTPTIC